MGSKQDDYNRGQKDGAQAGGFDEFVVGNNPLESPEYRKGFEHGRRQQLEARARDTAKVVPSSSANAPSDHDSGSGGGGGVGFGVGFGGSGLGGGGCAGKGCLIIIFLIVALPAGWFIKRQKRLAYIAELRTVRMSFSVAGKDVDESGAVNYAHGRPQTLVIAVNWEPQAVYWSERPLRITLSRNNKVQFDRLFQQDALNFNGFGFTITDKFPKGRYLLRAFIEGAPPGQYSFVVEPRPPGNIYISDTPPEWPRQNLQTLQHRPGERKKIFAYVYINGTLQDEGQIVYISLVHEGVTLFNYSNRVTEQNRNFYIPYEADFSEGLYTAKLWAPEQPSSQYTFKVQYPIVESPEEKSRRIKQFMDAIMPIPHQPGTADSSR